MENIQHKADFLHNQYTNHLQRLDSSTAPKWGKMNVQQMIEHMSDYVRIANGRAVLAPMNTEEVFQKMQAFLNTEKPFRENTPNVLMSETPSPVRNESHESAVAELQSELDHFAHTYKENPEQKIPNPFFGALNYEQQVQLLHKHSTHHLRQFGIDAN